MNIGEKIYNLRNKANLSQEAMGEKLGVSRQAVSKWETNQATPDLDNLRMLAEHFNVPLSNLIDDNIEKMVCKPEVTNTINKLTKARNVLLIIASSYASLLFLSFILIVILQKPLVNLLQLSYEKHLFVFPTLDFVGVLQLFAFILIISIITIKNKKEENNSIAKEIIVLSSCAILTNLYLTLPGLSTTLFKNLFSDVYYAISYNSLRFLLSYVEPSMIVVCFLFVVAMSLSLAIKVYKSK